MIVAAIQPAYVSGVALVVAAYYSGETPADTGLFVSARGAFYSSDAALGPGAYISAPHPPALVPTYPTMRGWVTYLMAL